MKTLTLAVASAALTFAAGAATAQSWTPINERQANLDARIEAGVRSGDLTRNEANRLRADFDAIAGIEARYRRDGLSPSERRDLDQRFDTLSARIRVERSESQSRDWYGDRDWTDNRGRWVPIERRKVQLDQRIEQGLRSGQLTRAEGARLRSEFDQIARAEYRYSRNGLNNRERSDLNRRFDQLAAQIRGERRDDDRRYGWNR
jgi:hypothetical protein